MGEIYNMLNIYHDLALKKVSTNFNNVSIIRKNIKYMNEGCRANNGGSVMYNDEQCRPEPCCGNGRPMDDMMDPMPVKNKAYEVRVNQMDYGYIVNVGCQSFSIETSKKLVKFLEKYWLDPKGTEKLWYSGKLGLED